MARELRTVFFKYIRNPDNGTNFLSDWSVRFVKSNEDKKEVFNKYLCSVFKEKADMLYEDDELPGNNKKPKEKH